RTTSKSPVASNSSSANSPKAKTTNDVGVLTSVRHFPPPENQHVPRSSDRPTRRRRLARRRATPPGPLEAPRHRRRHPPRQQRLLLAHRPDAAWPPADHLPLGPWKLRATGGVTRRANSAFTAGDQRLSDHDTQSLIEKTETFYTAHDLPPCFHISRYTTPPDL